MTPSSPSPPPAHHQPLSLLASSKSSTQFYSRSGKKLGFQSSNSWKYWSLKGSRFLASAFRVVPTHLPASVQRGPSSAYGSGKRLGTVSAASERTSANKTSSAAPGKSGMVQTPTTALHMARCTATVQAPHQRRAQPCAVEWQGPAGHGDGRGTAPELVSLRTSVRHVQRPARRIGDTNNRSLPARGCAIDDEAGIKRNTKSGGVGKPLLWYHPGPTAPRTTWTQAGPTPCHKPHARACRGCTDDASGGR